MQKVGISVIKKYQILLEEKKIFRYFYNLYASIYVVSTPTYVSKLFLTIFCVVFDISIKLS